MPSKAEVTRQQNCIHHWIIEPAGSHISEGKCKRCGKVAEFYNTYTTDLADHIKVPDKVPKQPAPSF